MVKNFIIISFGNGSGCVSFFQDRLKKGAQGREKNKGMPLWGDRRSIAVPSFLPAPYHMFKKQGGNPPKFNQGGGEAQFEFPAHRLA